MNPARVPSRVLGTTRVGAYAALTLEVPSDFPPSAPGHFVMLGLPGRHDPLLPRPFSLYGRVDDRLEVLVAEVGKGSRLLARLLPGDPVDVLGPLGTAFPAPDERPVLLLGGGVGVAPLRYYLQAWPDVRATSLLVFGGRGRAHVFAPPEAPARTVLTTDDGSAGLRGTVLCGLGQALEGDDPARYLALACGPDAMLRAVVRGWGARFGDLWASLEAHMACGMGACLGCVVPDGRGGYLRLCQEGPVLGREALLGRYRD